MSRSNITFRAIPHTAMRRLRLTPEYFFLVWRWSMWLYALIVIVWGPAELKQTQGYTVSTYLLWVTLLQTIIVTLYAPVIQLILPRTAPFNRLRALILRTSTTDEETAIIAPLGRRFHIYWDVIIYSVDVIICGLTTYLSGPFLQDPNFGVSSPFYRYGMSTAFAAALAYRYRGGLLAAVGYDLFIVLGIFFPPSGPPYTANTLDIVSSLIDTPLAALLSAYLVTLLANYTHSKRREQDNVRRQGALLAVGETLMREANNRESLLQKSAEQIRKGGHFQRLVVMLPTTEAGGGEGESTPDIAICVEATIPDIVLPVRDEAALRAVMHTHKTLNSFSALDITDSPGNKGYSLAQLYLPFIRNEQVHMILGAESRRQTPFDSRQELFLTIAGTQLSIALDNIRLTEQTIQLAATAERSRMAREIHDGVAQLVYMLSLNAETCATQAERIAEASDEDAELLLPLAGRLNQLVLLSKQALWETRTYMSSLKPLMSGTTTLTQMLTNQLREFETISGLAVRLKFSGDESPPDADSHREHRRSQVAMAVFRIVQEALTNAYKHAQATEIIVLLRFLEERIEVEICDNGQGLRTGSSSDQTGSEASSPIYSGRGLESMRERAEELDGTCKLHVAPSGGVSVMVSIPAS